MSTYLWLFDLLAECNETDLADLCEYDTVFLTAPLEEWNLLISQLRISFLVMSSHHCHDLLQLWALKHLVD